MSTLLLSLFIFTFTSLSLSLSSLTLSQTPLLQEYIMDVQMVVEIDYIRVE